MAKGQGRLLAAAGMTMDQPLAEQIASHLRNLILSGGIDRKARLPAQRILAKDFRVSRNTIMSALEQLTSEGLIEARHGSGTYVVANAPSARAVRLSPAATTQVNADALLALEVGTPALDMFPMATWAKLQTRRWQRLSVDALGEGSVGGLPALRALIAQRVAALRGIRCDASQVFVVPNVQVAVELAARCMAPPGATAWVEDPGYFRAREALANAGAKLSPVAVDDRGFNVDLALTQSRARLALVTPTRQFPTGAMMAPSRRAALVKWAIESDAWVIEDDYEADFCFEGRLPLALAAIGPQRTAYISTFSSTMFPALRIAFVVAPETLTDRFLKKLKIEGRMVSAASQWALLDFMELGHFAAHVRACTDIYGQRRAILLEALRSEFGNEAVGAPSIGLHATLWLPAGCSDDAFCKVARARGVATNSMSSHALIPTRQGLFLGFAPYSDAQIVQAVKQLAGARDAVI